LNLAIPTDSKLIAREDQMFLGMQEFDFAQIQSNLPKSHSVCPNFAQSLSKSNQIFPNLINFAPKIFVSCSCISNILSCYGIERTEILLEPTGRILK